MSNHLSILQNICDDIFRTANLDIELLDLDLNRILLLNHTLHPYSLTENLTQYYENMTFHLKSLDHSACYLHELPQYSLIFLDIRIQVSETEAYYACIGPVLSEIYDEMFTYKLMHTLNLPVTVKDSLTSFYKHLTFYTSQVKRIFMVCYYLLTSLADLSSIHFILDQTAALSTNLPLSTPFTDDALTSREDILLNYEKEALWRNAVSRGNRKVAKQAFAELSGNDFSYRTPASPFRTTKNVLHSVNALCRAAAIDGGVLPVDVHNTHEAFAIRIENAANTMDVERIENDLFDTYCDLVIAARTAGFSPIVTKAVNYLYTYYDQPITLHKVAEEIYCSEGHLSRIFQKETGKTLGAYLNELRIEHALSLLKQSTYSITSIAFMVGFSSYAKFSIEFKKYTGKSASEYLKTPGY